MKDALSPDVMRELEEFPPVQEAKLQGLEKLAEKAKELQDEVACRQAHTMFADKCTGCGLSLHEIVESGSEVCSAWKIRQERTKLHSRAENDFTFHPVTGDQGARYTENRRKAGELAHFLIEQCPPSRELSVALTKLDEVVYWSNAAIARNE